MVTPDWRRLVDHVMSIPERIYEHWNSRDGWDNDTEFGKQFGENGVSWCVMFDWDMYADTGLQSVVPKVDNVNTFSNWAKKRGQWSEYPSVGAWVNLSNGGHTEIVVGWNADYVFTKGGNTIATGAADNGQGNGVWLHDDPGTPRRSARVVGYFAPRFPDGICPPTADPDDPRGGKPVTAWRWSGPAAPTTPQTTTHPEDTLPAPVDVWAYENTKAGDKHDMHQALVNAETNSAKAVSAVAALDAKVAKLAVGGIDLDALAAKVAALLPKPATAAEIADLLAARLKA